MNNQRPGMLMPALIGGAVAGVLSGIPFINCLCCLWAIGGGMLAAFLLSKDSPIALTTGDGAIVGIFSGIIATIVDFFISIPLAPMANEFIRNLVERVSEYADEMPPDWETWLEGGAFESSLPMIMLGLVINVFIFSALGALGGIIGMSIFKKRFKPGTTKGVIDVPKDESKTEDSGHNQS